MESKPFRICPFCQSASPASEPRCVGCHRSLAGLPLPVYGSEIDATVVRPAPAPLVDLPLRGEPAPAVQERSTVEDGTPRPFPPVVERRRIGRGTKIAIAAAMMGVVLIGGWLVRAQDRSRADEHAARHGATATPPAAPGPSMTAGPFSSTAARVPPTEPARHVAAPPDALTPRASRPSAASSSRARAGAAAGWAVAPASGRPPASSTVDDSASLPAPPPTASRLPARTVARPTAPAAEPEAHVYTVHPDVRAAPVGVARARDDLRRDRALEETSEAALGPADLRSRLARAERRREAVAARVEELRARVNVPVIKDVEQYQRLQEALSAALDQLDRADAELARLRRTLADRE